MSLKNKKPKIAVIGLKGLPAFGGAANVGENIIEQLKNEYDFTVYSTSSHTDLKTGEYNGYKQIVFRKLPIKKLNSLYYYILSALHVVIWGRYNMVNLHHRDAAFIVPFIRLRYKVLLTTHGIGTADLSDKWNRYKWFFKIQENIFLKFANGIVSVAKRDYLLLIKKGFQKSYYIPNGVNIPVIDIDTNTEHYDIVFSAGRILSFKGCDLMLKALIQLHFTGSVLIIGELIENTEYTNEIKSLSKNLKVTFKGLIKNKTELLSCIKKGKIFIFPSSVEAMSIMLLEAASVQTPIICSDIQANKDIFNENEVLFFENHNANDLADKITYALNNRAEMEMKAKQAFVKLENKHNWKNITIEYSKLYQNLINNNAESQRNYSLL